MKNADDAAAGKNEHRHYCVWRMTTGVFETGNHPRNERSPMRPARPFATHAALGPIGLAPPCTLTAGVSP